MNDNPTPSRRPSRLIAASLAALLVALVGATSNSHSAPGGISLTLAAVRPLSAASLEAAGKVRVEVRFRTASAGTFVMSGAIVDKGSVKATQRVSGGRLELTETLTGASGTLRVRVTRRCSGGAGTWKVLSGSGAYAGTTGGGAASRGPACTGTRYPATAVYTGAVSTPPPPPIAQAGRFGGGTSQKTEVVLDVDPGGRTLSGVQLRLTAPCTGGVYSSTTAVFKLPGPYPIAPDGSFDIPVSQGLQTGRVRGHFTSTTTAEGTAEVSSSVTATTTNTTYPCAGSVTWRASQPPPTAPPGTYCGFSFQGPGVCFDVAASGREVTRFEGGVVVRCFPGGVAPSEFEFTLTITGSYPIGGHLGFSASGIALEGTTAKAAFSGVIDPNGTATGTVSVGAMTLEHEGTKYQCYSGGGKWEAKRQT